MTSFPMPSAGIRPILSERLAAVENDRRGVLNMTDMLAKIMTYRTEKLKFELGRISAAMLLVT